MTGRSGSNSGTCSSDQHLARSAESVRRRDGVTAAHTRRMRTWWERGTAPSHRLRSDVVWQLLDDATLNQRPGAFKRSSDWMRGPDADGAAPGLVQGDVSPHPWMVIVYRPAHAGAVEAGPSIPPCSDSEGGACEGGACACAIPPRRGAKQARALTSMEFQQGAPYGGK